MYWLVCVHFNQIKRNNCISFVKISKERCRLNPEILTEFLYEPVVSHQESSNMRDASAV